jgi:hypothetical protein
LALKTVEYLQEERIYRLRCVEVEQVIPGLCWRVCLIWLSQLSDVRFETGIALKKCLDKKARSIRGRIKRDCASMKP